MLRLVGLIIILQDAMLALNIYHRAIVCGFDGIVGHFLNGCVWMVIIAIIGVIFLFSPKWLLGCLTGDSRSK